MTLEGAYAVLAGNDTVDVSSVLPATWGCCDADAPAMLATIELLERDYCRDDLYWRQKCNVSTKARSWPKRSGRPSTGS